MTGILFSSLILRNEGVNRPPAGIEGRLFFDTTSGVLQRDNGVTWEDIEGGGDENTLEYPFVLPYVTPPTQPVENSTILYADYLPNTTTAIPTMTSDTAPSGVAFAKDFYTGNNPWKAFNVAQLGWIANGSGLPSWIGYQFPAGTNIVQYSFRPWFNDNYPARTPKAWKFQGSNNGSTYTDLDSQSGWVPQNSTDYVSFSFANETEYIYYRMYITETQTTPQSYPGIGGLKMFVPASTVGLWVMDSAGNSKRVS